MTDSEMLELAAKAAGVVLDGEWSDTDRMSVSAGGWWNPLHDDGDALRLAVKVLNWPHGGRAFDSAVTAMFAVGQLPTDPYTATRRAIVRAAAAIQQAKERT